MPVAKITLTVVKHLRPNSIVWDRDVKGFGVRRQRREIKYIVKSRVRGRDHWFTIGTHGAPWTPDTARQARQEAKRLLGEIAAGRNLVAIRDHEKSTPTFAAAAARFLEEHGKKVERRTIGEYERLVRRHAIPAFGTRLVDTIDRATIAKLHHSLSNTPRQANLLLSVLSKLMGWAAKRGLLLSEANPCKGIERYKENNRERFLTTAELSRLGEALRDVERERMLSPHAAAAVRLLLLTGARLSEILTLRWDQVDFDLGLLRLPRSKTGAKSIYLTKAAAKILKALPRVNDNPYVIVGDKPGAHLVNLQKPWSRVRARAGLDDVRLHDLRHSYASVGATGGLSLLFVGKLLGHTQPSTTQRYAHLAEDPVRQAGEQVSETIAAALAQKSRHRRP
jgi:integrase